MIPGHIYYAMTYMPETNLLITLEYEFFEYESQELEVGILSYIVINSIKESAPP